MSSLREFELGACFAAGTLVHTQEGLKPIEDIKVGDMVLSKHESGEGERAYKRVTKTFVHEDREVLFITVGGMQPSGQRYCTAILVTPEHPIWVQGKGWKEAAKVKKTFPPTFVDVLSDITPRIVGHTRTYTSNRKGFAWTPGVDKMEFMGRGTEFDIKNFNASRYIDERGFPPIGEEASFYDETVPLQKRMTEPHRCKATVYNIEVEDFHTYYITVDGIWVGAENSNFKSLSDALKQRKQKDKPKPAPYTAEKAYAIISEIVGHPWLQKNSLLEKYRLTHLNQITKKNFVHQRYKFESTDFANSHVFIKTAVKHPDSILLMGFSSTLPEEFSPSRDLVKFCSEKAGFDFSFFMGDQHDMGSNLLNLIEHLEHYQIREKSHKTGRQIQPEELPWHGMKDLPAIKPAIKVLFTYSLKLAEKCKTLEGWNWLFNSSDDEAMQLYSGNRHNSPNAEPKLSRQIPSLYLAKKLHSPNYEELLNTYLETWKDPEIRKKYKKINIDPTAIVSIWVEALQRVA